MVENDELLELIEENIRNLVIVQKQVNEDYKNITQDNYEKTYEKILQGLYDEKDLLNALTNNLNKYFEITSGLFFKKFRIVEDGIPLCRYIIRTPLRLNKNTQKYVLLKKLLINLHKEYFLCNGGLSYTFSSVESHMWEIPNFIDENELTQSMRKKYKYLKK